MDILQSVAVTPHFGRVVSVGNHGQYFLRVPIKPLPKTDAPYIKIPHVLYALTDIFNAQNAGKLSEGFPHLSAEDLHLCSAFLATNVPDHPAYKSNNRNKRVKILFDENLPYALVSALTAELPCLSHVYLEGMDGASDEFIFNRPWAHLKPSKASERKQKRATKHIIISRDSDMTDLAQGQWLKRMQSSSHPEDIRFDDVNVVFRVVDESLTNIQNADKFKEVARDIMRAAYSQEGASYTISLRGVDVEQGSYKQQLIRKLEDIDRIERAKKNCLTEQEIADGKSGRCRGKYDLVQEIVNAPVFVDGVSEDRRRIMRGKLDELKAILPEPIYL